MFVGLSSRTWCKHYRGMHKKETCEAGVRFDSLPTYGTPAFMDSCPCFADVNGCEQAAYPTPEEVVADEAELQKLFEGMCKARAAITEDCGGPWKRGDRGRSGRIACPVCGVDKALNYSRSSFNGHVHAACDTAECVRWME